MPANEATRTRPQGPLLVRSEVERARPSPAPATRHDRGRRTASAGHASGVASRRCSSVDRPGFVAAVGDRQGGVK
jgi:hypothetical protein